MIRFAVRGLAGRKLRTALTAIAIVLGVAMVSGTFVLTDSIDKAFDAIFPSVYSGTDAVDHRQDGVRRHAGQGHDVAAARSPDVAARRRSRRCPASRTRSAASAARRS